MRRAGRDDSPRPWCALRTQAASVHLTFERAARPGYTADTYHESGARPGAIAGLLALLAPGS